MYLPFLYICVLLKSHACQKICTEDLIVKVTHIIQNKQNGILFLESCSWKSILPMYFKTPYKSPREAAINVIIFNLIWYSLINLWWYFSTKLPVLCANTIYAKTNKHMWREKTHVRTKKYMWEQRTHVRRTNKHMWEQKNKQTYVRTKIYHDWPQMTMMICIMQLFK